MNLHFIGFGNMAKAIARGLAKNPNYKITASAPSLISGINQDNIQTHQDNKALIATADVIVLAVKPAKMHAVLHEINPFIPPNCLLISVAAGLSIKWFAEHGPKHQALIRTMPNTAASIGRAATPMYANASTRPEQKQCAEAIFAGIGITTWTASEDEIDSFTALSGSGPAYVFLLMEAMIDAAVALGIDAAVAKQFTLQTLEGAVCLAKTSGESIAALRTQVTSPGGTTAAALEVLQGPLHELMANAMRAAKNKAQALGA